MRVFQIDGIATSNETLSTITTAIGFTSSKILPTTGSFAGKQARAALITVEAAAIRFFLDGTTPTVTGGAAPGLMLYNSDSYLVVGESNVANFLCINAVNANGAIVRCQFFF